MKAYILAYLLSAVFDTSTTVVAMRHGCQEANPILKMAHIITPRRVVAYQGGMAVAVTFTLGRDTRYPKRSKILLGSLAVGHAVAGAWNSNQACQKE